MNGAGDVFVHDRLTGATERFSVASDGTKGEGEGAAISSDGRLVAFHSFASSLVSGDTNGLLDVFVHDRLTGATERVSVASDNTQENGKDSQTETVMSADGRFVDFDS